MSSRYVEPQSGRSIRERVDGCEQIRIPTRRNWFALIFLSVWLTFWTFGGIATAGGFAVNATGHQNAAEAGGALFLGVWLIFWAVGWVFAATTIALQIAGSEIIRVVGQDLEISLGAGRLRRRKLYRGDLIRNLVSTDPNPLGWPFRAQQLSFPGTNRAGAIKFDYGAKTIRAAASVDEAEGRTIVEWLRPKLPSIASDGSASFR